MPAEGAPIALDHLFPRSHLRPPAGYLNDPNGPLLIGGVCHLYFQYRLTTDLDSPVLWGHASSTDLVHWQHQRPALTPHPVGPDRDGCWSGNTVRRPDGRIRAFYSGLRADHAYQSVLVADSDDGGATFGPPHQVLDDPGPQERIFTFRDPFVWADGDGWLLTVGAGDADGVASARLYRSADLDHWERIGDLARLPRTAGAGAGGAASIDTGAMWECPQVVDLAPAGVDAGRSRPVLLAGAWARTEGTMRVYAIHGVRTDGATPAPDRLRLEPLDAGPDFYAASVLRSGPDGGAVLWGWVREARDHGWSTEQGWSGSVTLPRTLELGPDDGLRVAPHPAVLALRDGALEVGPAGAEELPGSVELVARVPAGQSCRLRLVFGPVEWLELELDRVDDRVLIDTTRASRDPRTAGAVTVVPDAFGNGEGELRLFLDGSVIELFTGGGRAATLRCYPTNPPPWRLAVVEGAAELALWRLGPSQHAADASAVRTREVLAATA